ncbi:MAG: lipid-A-disaccharide synthase [Cytophagales bacterium]
MKYYLIAGERSGDLHGSNLIKSLKKYDSNAEFRCLGGDLMQKEGAVLYRHYSEISYMLIGDVIRNIFTIFKNFSLCAKDIESYKPDALILIDFSGFNMQIAKRIKPKGIPIHYYISPKIWAWNQSRAYNIKKLIDYMYVIMPFEKQFYKKYNYEVDYVGNPILDAISNFKPNPNFKNEQYLNSKPIVAVLPGSRKQEVENMLEKMMLLSSYFKEYEFVIAAVDNLSENFYQKYKNKGFKVVTSQTYDLLHNAHAALVTSGTATLETALFNVPQIVCYQTGFITYSIVKFFIKIRFISLVNLIADKEIVKEMIQGDFEVSKLKIELENILEGPKREQMLADYQFLKSQMGTVGASDKTAELIAKRVKL